MSPRVIAVVLNWNGWEDTVRCVGSLLDGDYDNQEVVIVDNQSTNDSVARLREAYPHLKLIVSTRNLGFGGGCNLGIAAALEAGADLVWLINNDAVVAPDALSKLVEKSVSPDVGIVGGVVFDMVEPQRLQTWGGGSFHGPFGAPRFLNGPSTDAEDFYITGACLLIKTDVIRAVGMLDASFFMYWEDADWSLRVASAGYRLVVADEAVIYHERCASTGKESPQREFMFHESFVQFYLKHWRRNPIAIGMIGSNFLKRLGRGKPMLAVSVLRGALSGAWKSIAYREPSIEASPTVLSSIKPLASNSQTG